MVEERLESLHSEVARLKEIVDGNGTEGLRKQVNDLTEVMFGGTPRVPVRDSMQHMTQQNRDMLRDAAIRLDTVSKIGRWVVGSSLATFVGLVILILKGIV